MQKYFLIISYLILCGKICVVNAQNIISGKYVEYKNDSFLFKGVIILKSNSTFSYESVGTIKDQASGTFKFIEGIVYLKYNDGCSETSLSGYKKNGGNYPLELYGLALTCDGRPKKLIYEGERLYSIIVNKKRQRKKYQKSEYFYQLIE